MKKFLTKIINNLVGSFDTEKGGFSSRKLTAFITVLCIIYIHIKFVDVSNSLDVLMYDMLFVLVLFGIVTSDQLYRFKKGTSQPPTDTPTNTPVDMATTGTTETTIINP